MSRAAERLTSMDDTVVENYIFYKSPLKTAKGLWSFGLIVFILGILASFGFALQEVDILAQAFIWVPYVILGSVLGYLLVYFVDRQRSILWLHALVIASVAFFTAHIAVVFNTISPAPLQTVGFVEESVKLLPLILLAIYLPAVIRTKKDGIVYGALAGLGFNFIETALYITQAMAGGAPLMEAIYTHTTRLAFLGLDSHIIWSALTGLGLGWSIQSAAKGWRRWRPFVLCFLVAALAHSLYDSFGVGFALILTALVINLIETGQLAIPHITDAASALGRPGLIRDAARYETYLYNFFIVIFILVQLWRSWKYEHKVTVDQLENETAKIISGFEKKQLQHESKFRMRHYDDVPKRYRRKLVKYQNWLAMLKETVNRHGGDANKTPEVQRMRRSIADMRTLFTK